MPPSENAAEIPAISTLRAMHALLCYAYPPKKMPEIAFLTSYPKTSMPFPYVSLRYLRYEVQQDDAEAKQRIISDSLRWIATYGSYKDRFRFSQPTVAKVWDEAAIAVRVIVLALAFLLTDRPEEKELLHTAACEHFRILCDPETYRSDHSHGFYQNVAALCFCKTFPDTADRERYMELIEERILRMCSDLFTADGFLKAHSPGYHQVLLRGHLEILQHFSFSPSFRQKLLAILPGMAGCLRQFLRPNGTLAQLGDTDLTPPFAPCREAMQKLPPLRSLDILTDSGYAFIHTPENVPAKEKSHLAFIGAFYSREHKHCDDLSFIWDEGEMEIIVDSGKHNYKGHFSPGTEEHARGFWYNAPPRVYTESIHAHNCIEINGRSPSRRIPPYGVLPIRGGLLNSGAYFLGAAWHRPEGFRQERLLLFKPGSWLLLLDSVIPAIAGAATLMTQWLHFSPHFRITENAQGDLTLAHAENNRLLYCRTLLPHQATSVHQGEVLPRLQGWSAADINTLIPHPAWGVHAMTLQKQTFATICALDSPAACAIRQDEQGRWFCAVEHKGTRLEETLSLDCA